MQKEILLLFFIAIVTLIVLINLSFTGAAGVRFTGEIVDKDGNPVLTSRYNYWESAEGTVRAVPGKFNKIVAYDETGRFLGEGNMKELSYGLNLRHDWETAEFLILKIGAYDPYRPGSTILVPCTTIPADVIKKNPMLGTQSDLMIDLVCTEMKALEKFSAVGYR